MNHPKTASVRITLLLDLSTSHQKKKKLLKPQVRSDSRPRPPSLFQQQKKKPLRWLITTYWTLSMSATHGHQPVKDGVTISSRTTGQCQAKRWELCTTRTMGNPISSLSVAVPYSATLHRIKKNKQGNCAHWSTLPGERIQVQTCGKNSWPPPVLRASQVR